MSLCIGVTSEDFALVASDCYSGARPERSAELGGRVASLPNGWVTYTSLSDGMSKVAAGALEETHIPAYRPEALQERVTWAYETVAPQLRRRRMGPDTGDHGFEAAFFVASVGPNGPYTWMLFSDGESRAISPGQAYVSPPPGMSEELEERHGDEVHWDYLATSPDVWTAFRRAGEVQREHAEDTGYVSRHMHVCAVAEVDGRWSKRASLFDSGELAEMDLEAIREKAVAFEGCMSPEMLRERARARAAAGGR